MERNRHQSNGYLVVSCNVDAPSGAFFLAIARVKMPCSNCKDGICQNKCVPPVKKCTMCNVLKPLHEFHANKSECKPCSSNRVLEWKRGNKERVNEQNRKRTYELRMAVIAKLGGSCSECGNQDSRVLQIDHIGGGGSVDRATKHRTTLWNEILNGKNGFQLLCANCHCIKTFENGEYGNVR